MGEKKNSYAALRTVQKLIHEIAGDEWELDAARALSFEELRALRNTPNVIDLILRRVSEQKTKKNLIDRLKSFAAFLDVEEAGAQRTPKKALAPFLTRIAGRKLDASEDRYVLISTSEILYLFLGYAMSSGVIRAPSMGQLRFRKDRVYVRTQRGIFVTNYSSLKDLRDRLDPQLFSPIYKSLVVNLQRISIVEFSRNVKEVGFALPDGSLETLIVSRRYFRGLRSRLGFSKKTRGKQADIKRGRS